MWISIYSYVSIFDRHDEDEFLGKAAGCCVLETEEGKGKYLEYWLMSSGI